VTPRDDHPANDLQLLLEDLLAAERRAEVEAHLADCPRCRRELEAIRRVRAAARRSRPEPELPEGLASRVSASLDAVDRASRRARRARWLVPLSLAAAAILAVVLWRTSSRDPVRAAARDYASYRASTLPLELATSDVAALQRFFADHAPATGARVFDFGMMSYRLMGGRVHRLAGRDAVLFAYRGTAGNDLVCVMYPGRLSELPPGADERLHQGIPFRVYRRGGVTLVFWQEGETVCVLVSGGASEEAIQLAYAKAVKA
jgi:anti-sigma factor RsiW